MHRLPQEDPREILPAFSENSIPIGLTPGVSQVGDVKFGTAMQDYEGKVTGRPMFRHLACVERV